MKAKTLKSKISLFALSALMLLSLGVTANAESDGLVVDNVGSSGETSVLSSDELQNVNGDEVGKISLKLSDGAKGTSKSGVSFSCLKVADIVDGEYVLIEDLKSLGVDINNIQNAKDLESAATKLAENTNNGSTTTTDMSGKLTFMDLEVGVYLLKATNTANYDSVTPFLVSIPTFDSSKKVMVYELEVEPKHTPKPTPETKTPKSAPQTNLNSPVVMYFGLAGLAMVMLVVVNVSYSLRKKKKVVKVRGR